MPVLNVSETDCLSAWLKSTLLLQLPRLPYPGLLASLCIHNSTATLTLLCYCTMDAFLAGPICMLYCIFLSLANAQLAWII
ncbi:hypothetical protein XELAEV_18006471mg [Xenopus laevis]|uniref:Uncharacterized protein n=1 Tax=Xenopus laevis TaxID=8355 RepID=A0A974E0M0_XENLA|nr:hypothetical protein XELAEV_18006471mg [Xenopus laevis]